MSQLANDPNLQRILVVDDEKGIRDGLRVSLEHLGYQVDTAASGEEALYQFRQQSSKISFVLSDFKMPGLDGFDVLREIKKQSPSTKVVLMTGFGNVNHAVSAMQAGADDYLCKPFHFEDLEKIILRNQPSSIQFDKATGDSNSIISQNENFITLLRKAERAAKSSAPLLIEGPSGTGKELLAKQIHQWSLRKDKPWVAINCAALPAGLLESELFGFEKGAFTGALEKKQGKFEQAHTGTLLLDEIGELDPVLQAKLLRVLQEGEVDRLGGKKSFKVDVRIIATTNRNLEKLVGQGRFREDLFFRLYGVRLTLPALRERSDDIPLLAKEFLKRHSKEQGRDLELTEEVLPALAKMNWPGNIRELERAIERAAVLSETGLIRLEHFEFTDKRESSNVAIDRNLDGAAMAKRLNSASTSKSIREMEKDIILSALDSHSGNRTHTAKALGMSLRTLRHKLKVYRDSDETRQIELGKNEPFFQMDAPLDSDLNVSTDG